jgi:general secretion pathway protein C
MNRAVALGLPLAAVALAACGGASASVKVASPAPKTAAVAPAPSPADAPPDHSLRRSVVVSVVNQGLGSFLQAVVLDDQPVMKGGRFYGFKIASLDPGFFKGVDLQPGDVVEKVNGMSIEHPEEALEAFRALQVAEDLRVQYQRDGKERELSYAIVDDAP